MHGKTSRIVHDGSSLFAGLPSPLRATRYHSLVIEGASVPGCLRVIARVEGEDEIMAVAHREHPVVGVQFHPESAATEYGYAMLDRFLRGEGSRPQELPARADLAREAAEATLPEALPWVSRRYDTDGRFVPPPVDLVR
jgi:hypothetical protein